MLSLKTNEFNVSTFIQITDPLRGSLALAAICAALPRLLLFVPLGVFRVKAAKAAIAALVLSILLAIFVWQMPWEQAFGAAAAGAGYGVFPILWILVNALWVYKLTVATRPGSTPQCSPYAGWSPHCAG